MLNENWVSDGLPQGTAIKKKKHKKPLTYSERHFTKKTTKK